MESEIPHATLRALRRILRATESGNRRLAAVTGLTPSQLLVLNEIGGEAAETPGSVAQRLQFSHATITAIVDRLVEQGLATRARSEKDKRQFLLSATAAGRAALAEAPDLLQMTFAERFAVLPKWEQAMILAAVEKLAVVLDAQDIDAAPLLDTGAIDRNERRD